MTNAGEVHELPGGLRAITRGWLHGNTLVSPGPELTIFDTGYHTGVDALIDRVERAAAVSIDALRHVYLTHVHSDHAGGCAALQTRTRARTWAHPACAALVGAWDRRRLWLAGMGQTMPRFRVDATLTPDQEFARNGITWRVVDTPGHALGGVAFYAPRLKLLVSGDALWRHGFGMLHTALEGEACVDLCAQALDRIAALDVALVVPGHGPPFCEVEDALTRARRRLAAYRRDRARVVQADLRASVAFWLMANEGGAPTQLTNILQNALTAYPVLSATTSVDALLAELAGAGILIERDGRLYPGPRLTGRG